MAPKRKEKKVPPSEDADRCLRIRIASKQGRFDATQETRKFIEKMFNEYPDWYAETEFDVFIGSAPFGARLPTKEEWFHGRKKK